MEVALITSRETGRWVIPKGWPMAKKKPHAAAAREALEEAGLVGEGGREPIGSYAYDKRLRDGTVVRCHVAVFPLAVTKQRKRFRERGMRSLCWMSGAEAAEAVVEPELKDIFEHMDELLTGSTSSAPAPRSAGAPAPA